MATGRPGMSGIVLAGGAGRRMGRPKAMVSLGGVCLVELAAAILHEYCDEVVVVSRPGVPLPPMQHRVVLDRPGPDAPLTGIATGLAQVSSDQVLVLACDLPFAAAAVAAIARALPARSAVIASEDGYAQPLCARYPREAALAAVTTILADGGRRAMALAEAVGAVHVLTPRGSLLNINTPRELQRARSAA